jgi:hypothetical protein
MKLVGKYNLDIGDAFWCIKRTYYEGSTLGKGARYFSNTSDPRAHSLRGVFLTEPAAHSAAVTNDSFPGLSHTPANQLGAKASSIISDLLPTIPEVDVTTGLAELLREGLPSLVMAQSLKSRALTAKNAGNEYLNVEFGWKPLVNDVKAFAKALENDVKRLDELLENANKLLRRKRHLPVETSTSITDLGNSFPQPGLTSYHQTQGKKTLTVTQRNRQWFSGAFWYQLSAEDLVGPGLATWLTRAKLLYGVRLTPDVLWNLSPWSWLADWFGNVGDVLQNISLFFNDRLVMPWAYIMEHKTLSWRYDLRGVEFKSYPGRHDFYQEFRVESKYRQAASPFSIGWKDGSLNNRQKAIGASVVATRR